MRSDHWLSGFGAVVLLIGSIPCAAAQQRPGADTAWRYRAAADIRRVRDCPTAELLMTTKSALLAIDATTGGLAWQLDDLPNLEAGLYWGGCDAHTGISYRKDKIVAFDLGTGRRLWDAAALPPFQEIRGYVSLSRDDLLLLFLRTAASDRALAAVQLSTGALRWQRDDVFAQSPQFGGRGGVSDISEFQVVLTDSDTTLILYVSPDGPMRLDARSGATLWVGGALAGRRVPAVREHAAMRLVDSTLVIPYGKGLLALDARDGRLLWDSPDLLPRRATRLSPQSTGLLVRAGRAYVNVLDPVTGSPRWAHPLTVPTDGAAYEIVGDRYFVVAQDRLLVADLATGDTTGLATLSFDDGEHAELMFAADDHLLVASRQNLTRVDFAGAIAYHRFYHAPGASFFQVLGGVSPGATFGSAAFRSEYAYFVTNAPDAAGRSGNSLVRVTLADGSEAGRIWFREKAPKYRPDTARDQILIIADDRTLVAVRFPVPVS